MSVARLNTCWSAIAVIALSVFSLQVTAEDKPILGESKGFAVQGKQFRLYQKHDLKGALTEQMLFAKDRVVVSSDPHGTGALQSWQLIEPHRSVLLHDPVKGRFRFMDIVEDTPKGRLEMKFILADKKSYRLLSVARRNSHKLLDGNTTQDFEVGCRSMEKGLQEQAADFDQLVQNQSSAKGYRSVVQKDIMDSTCNDPKSAFASSMPSMLDGIMEVVNSDPQWNRKLADGDSTVKMSNGKIQPTIAATGSFLQCLRNHDLDAHASRIEAGLGNYMKMISPAGKSGGFDWKISCQKTDSEGTSDDPVDALGAFEPSDSHPPKIDFYKLASQMPKAPGQTTADVYAEVFFHEMIHYSLIADEVYTKQMELCCSKPANRPMPSGQYQGQPACDALDATVRAKLYSQQFENATADQTGSVPLAKIRESMRDRLGTGADIMIDQFQTSIGSDYAKYKSDSRCSNSQKGLTAECDAAFKADLAKDYTALMSNCNSFGRSAGMSSTELYSYCGSFGAYEEKLLGLDTGKVDLASICRKKKTAAAPAPELQSFAYAVETFAHWLSWTNLSVDAFADDDSSFSASADGTDDSTVQLFCSQVPQVHSVWDQVASYDPYGGTVKSLDATLQKFDSSTTVGNDTTSSPIKASGDALSYDSHGPPASEYSKEPSTREHQILSDLNRQDSMFGNAASALSDRLAQTQFIPVANAQPSSETISRTNYANSGSVSNQYSAPVPASVPSSLPAARPLRLPASDLSLPKVTPSNITIPSPIDYSSDPAPLPTNRGARLANANANSTIAAGSSSIDKTNGDSASARPGTQIIDNSKVVIINPPAVAGNATTATPIAAQKAAHEKSKHTSAADERALAALLAYLQRPYRDVRPELDRPSVVESMKRHAVQVIDDEGSVYGSGYPEHKLTFDRDRDRLVLEKRAPAKAER